MSEEIRGRVVILRSNPVAPDPRVEKLARALKRGGWKALIFAWDRTGKLPKAAEDTPIGSIYRLRLRARYGSGLRNLPCLLLWQVYLLYALISRRARFDVIHACDFDTVLPALLAGKLFNKRVVFDIFDMYSDSVRGTPDLILQAVARTERWAIDHADAVILADESRKEQIAGSTPKKLAVVYNSPEEEAISPVDPQAGGGFRLVYVGLLVKERSLSEVIQIVGEHPNWQFDLAGFGGDEELILAQARQHENIRWHGRVVYADALALTASADVVFAIYDPGIPNHRYSSPNKVFEAMLLGKPLVVARDTNMDRIVEAHNCGMVVNYGELDEIRMAFETLAVDKAGRKLLGENAKEAYRTYYSWAVMQERILGLYSEL